MQRVSIDDPAWRATFPHRVAPLPNEWLPGLLLRCDMVNGWGAGTTLALIRSAISTYSSYQLNITAPPLRYLEHVSQVLALPFQVVVATTYQAEIDRLSDETDHLLIQPLAKFQFSLCPQCVAGRRKLTRTLLLPHITICPQHHLMLQTTCRCGASLQLFSQKVPPFTCPACGMYWNRLPRCKASPGFAAIEQRLLSFYLFFFSKGTAKILTSALRLIEEREAVRANRNTFFLLRDAKRYRYVGQSFYRDRLSLGYVVYSLVRLNISLDDIMISAKSFAGNVSFS